MTKKVKRMELTRQRPSKRAKVKQIMQMPSKTKKRERSDSSFALIKSCKTLMTVAASHKS